MTAAASRTPASSSRPRGVGSTASSPRRHGGCVLFSASVPPSGLQKGDEMKVRFAILALLVSVSGCATSFRAGRGNGVEAGAAVAVPVVQDGYQTPPPPQY